MTEEIRCKIGQLPGLINRRMQRLEGRVRRAMARTADDGVEIIRLRTPKAFGELAASVHAVDADHAVAKYVPQTEGHTPKIVLDAPHAAAVEIGSKPHMPDMEALIAWVKLRGMQGLTERGNRRTRFRRDMGPTTPEMAMRVARMLADTQVRGRRGQHGRFSPVDAPTQVAAAIAKGIKAYGTKPHWFVRDSLPGIAMRLAKHVREAMGK